MVSLTKQCAQLSIKPETCDAMIPKGSRLLKNISELLPDNKLKEKYLFVWQNIIKWDLGCLYIKSELK